MFRYLASLRVIGEVILSSLSSFISIAALLFLFLLVFAIVGLHVFGGLRDPDSFRYGIDDPQFGGRASFDSFYHSTLLTFQVRSIYASHVFHPALGFNIRSRRLSTDR
jgi:hypothetical protein|tara:strand:+ start:51 stop:374 length:324 start_codon:yes stop_codon:yes gene_type:complete|eukprot:30852-Pelagococcus_subviridis.AAC.8